MSYDNSLGKRKSRNRTLSEVKESYFFLYFLRKATLHKNSFISDNSRNMKSIRIEFVGDINSTYPYLEVFQEQALAPFMEVGITDGKELCFKFYPIAEALTLSLEQWERILTVA
jgi:hypothetical protein